jgi:tetratricopeptide (TPR) repeat protein
MQGDPDHVQAGLRLAEGLFAFFWTTGYLSEGRHWLGALLARDPDQPPTDARAWALSAAAKLAAHHGDDASAQALAHEYLALPASLHQAPASALVHTALSIVALHAGDMRTARQHTELALELSRSAGEFSAPLYPTYLAELAASEGRLDEATQLYEEALAEGRATDFPLPVGIALDGLARLARTRGDLQRARALWEEGLDLLRAVGSMPQTAALLVALGELAIEDGDPVQGRARFGEGLEVAAGAWASRMAHARARRGGEPVDPGGSETGSGSGSGEPGGRRAGRAAVRGSQRAARGCWCAPGTAWRPCPTEPRLGAAEAGQTRPVSGDAARRGARTVCGSGDGTRADGSISCATHCRGVVCVCLDAAGARSRCAPGVRLRTATLPRRWSSANAP